MAIPKSRQNYFERVYQHNVTAGRPPYAGVRIKTADELWWIIEQRGWRYETSRAIPTYYDANFTEANLMFLDLSDVQLIGICFNGANLIRCRFHHAMLNSAQMIGADLTDADLTDASLNRADLTNANLTNVNLLDTSIWQNTLTGANLTNVKAGYGSHELIAEIIRRAAKTPEQEYLATFILANHDCCWSDFAGQVAFQLECPFLLAAFEPYPIIFHRAQHHAREMHLDPLVPQTQ